MYSDTKSDTVGLVYHYLWDLCTLTKHYSCQPLFRSYDWTTATQDKSSIFSHNYWQFPTKKVSFTL